MNNITAQAFFDELEKISRIREATEIGKLVNGDKGQPSSENEGGRVQKHLHRPTPQSTSDLTATPSEEKTPEATSGQGNLTL